MFDLRDLQWTRQSRVSPKGVAAEADEVYRQPEPKQSSAACQSNREMGKVASRES